MVSVRSIIVLGTAAVMLSACGNVREDLGLGRNPPDEFAVVERPPLSMPPDYGLHPPRPGAPRPQDVTTTQRASETLFNGNVPATTTAPSAGETALLSATGASKADPSIRDTVDHEAAQKVTASPHLVQRLLDSSSDQKSGTVVNAPVEADRIKKDQADNQPVNQGATPIIEKQESGWLGL